MEILRILREANADGGAGGIATAVVPPPPTDDRLRQTQNELMAAQLENARLKARVAFPNVPENLLNMFVGTPDQVHAFAEQMSQTLTAQPPAPGTAPQPPNGAPASVQAGAPASQAVASPEPPPAPVPGLGLGVPSGLDPDEQYFQELKTKVLDRTATKEEIRLMAGVKGGGRSPEQVGAAFRRGWNRHMEQRRSGRGDF